jgi:hypothetical protein
MFVISQRFAKTDIETKKNVDMSQLRGKIE